MSKLGIKTTSRDGFIQFEVDGAMLRMIENALGSLKSESRKVLKNAVNATARQAKVDLAKKAQETYVVKQTRFSKAMKTKNATVSNPTATINVTGEQLELKDYKVSPATYKTGSARPSVVKAKVLLSSSLKGLQIGSLKAFIVKFTNTSKSGKTSSHVSVAQRKGKARFPIKKLLSNSIPKMIGSQDRVFGVIEPEIYDNLMDNIKKEIDKVVKSA